MEKFFKHVDSLDESDDEEYVDFSKEKGEFYFYTVDEQSKEVESIGHEHLEGLDPFTFRSDHNWYTFTKISFSL